MIVDDIGVCHVRLQTVFRRLNGVFHIEVIEDAGEEGQRPGEIHVDVQKALNGPVEPVHKGHGGRDGTDGEAGVGLRNDEPAAGKIDEQRPQLGEHAHDHAEPLAAALLLQLELGDLLVHVHKALVLPFLPGKELHQERAGYR